MFVCVFASFTHLLVFSPAVHGRTCCSHTHTHTQRLCFENFWNPPHTPSQAREQATHRRYSRFACTDGGKKRARLIVIFFVVVVVAVWPTLSRRWRDARRDTAMAAGIECSERVCGQPIRYRRRCRRNILFSIPCVCVTHGTDVRSYTTRWCDVRVRRTNFLGKPVLPRSLSSGDERRRRFSIFVVDRVVSVYLGALLKTSSESPCQYTSAVLSFVVYGFHVGDTTVTVRRRAANGPFERIAGRYGFSRTSSPLRNGLGTRVRRGGRDGAL